MVYNHTGKTKCHSGCAPPKSRDRELNRNQTRQLRNSQPALGLDRSTSWDLSDHLDKVCSFWLHSFC
jgi:hypothetical protein